MPGTAVCLPPGLEESVLAQLQQHGLPIAFRAGVVDELVDVVSGGDLDFAIVGADAERLTSGLLAACDAAGVRLVAIASDPGDRSNALGLGLQEVVDASAGWPGLEAMLFRSRIVGEPPPPPARRGETIAVWGPAGSPGRTTVAISIAAELAAEGRTVVLADADTHSGSIAPALGLLDEAPGFAAACRLAGADGLTPEELDRIAERYPSSHGGFRVLTGIGRPRRWPELSGERVVATLAACRAWADYTVVDTGFSLENDEEISSDLFAPRRNAATISALREADRVIAVGSGDPVGMSRFLRAHVDLLELVEAERVTTVVNKIRGSAIGLNPAAQVEQTLLRFGGIVAPVLVPHDQAALDAAILSGKTLRDVAGKSPARLAVNRLVTSRILRPRLERPAVAQLAGSAPS